MRGKTGLHALALNAYAAYAQCMQYTIRNLPARLDKLIRKRAKEEGKSLNTVAVEALMEAFGLGGSSPSHRDVGDLAESWVEDAVVEEALQAQRRIDDEMWR
jgi:DNA polymerase III delta subunit